MKYSRFLTVLCVCGMLFANGPAVTAYADETAAPVTGTTDDEETRSTQLIESNKVWITSGVQKIYINAYTTGNGLMAQIGIKDITIQRSADGTSGWTDALTMSDQIVTNSDEYNLSQYTVSVTGGYYYRVVLTHYAKEQGWLFPNSESIPDTSNVAWAPPY